MLAGAGNEVLGADQEALAAELRAWGLTEDEIAAELERGRSDGAGDDALAVEPENVEAVCLFQRLATQWTWTQMGGGMAGTVAVRCGLRYEAIPFVAGALGLEADAEMLDRLRIMETETAIIEARRAREALTRH